MAEAHVVGWPKVHILSLMAINRPSMEDLALSAEIFRYFIVSIFWGKKLAFNAAVVRFLYVPPTLLKQNPIIGRSHEGIERLEKLLICETGLSSSQQRHIPSHKALIDKVR